LKGSTKSENIKKEVTFIHTNAKDDDYELK